MPQNSYAVKFYMISESNCINIVDVSMSVNIFDIFGYSFDQNRLAPSPKDLASPNFWKFPRAPKEFFPTFLTPSLKLGGADAMSLLTR